MNIVYSESETMHLFYSANSLLHSLCFCILPESETCERYEELMRLLDKIGGFVAHATHKKRSDIVDLALSLILDRQKASVFVLENSAFLVS